MKDDVEVLVKCRSADEAHHEPLHPHEEHVTTRVLPDGETAHLKLPTMASLLALLQEGADHAGVSLLPNRDHPLDHLHNIEKHDHTGPVIDNLDQALGDFLKTPESTRNFGIELVLAFCVNTRWAVAPKTQMTPREILALPKINLDPTQYTLYREKSTDPLPLDQPIAITRGLRLEAQKDGRYGEGTCPPYWAGQIEQLAKAGVPARSVQVLGQNYALVENLEAPSPPWEKPAYAILIALPLDESGMLDGFYLSLPYKFNNGDHTRVNGSNILFDQKQWRQVSWHYAQGKDWTRKDNLETHITFCRGFFSQRGATNAY
jgi:hypothetical protein